MTQEDLNQLAKEWDNSDSAPIGSRKLGVIAYQEGFKKALELVNKHLEKTTMFGVSLSHTIFKELITEDMKWDYNKNQ